MRSHFAHNITTEYLLLTEMQEVKSRRCAQAGSLRWTAVMRCSAEIQSLIFEVNSSLTNSAFKRNFRVVIC